MQHLFNPSENKTKQQKKGGMRKLTCRRFPGKDYINPSVAKSNTL